jgi:hypothetical protein
MVEMKRERPATRDEGRDPIFAGRALSPSLTEVLEFQQRSPFPWRQYVSFIRPAFYETLHEEFPGISWFEKHENLPRGPQRPHNRYYLAFENSIYHQADAPPPQGITTYSDLSPAWQGFIDALRSQSFIEFVALMFGSAPARLRFAWHRAYSGCEVSPHTDSSKRLGTFVFYFNTRRDWDYRYGGETLLLGGLKGARRAPDFFHFETTIAVPVIDIQCLVFRKTEDSWHGVKPLRCPKDYQRKTFHVMAEAL